MNTTKTRQPKQRVRSISVAVPMNEQGLNGIVCIREGKKVEEYFLDRLTTDFGEGFVMEKRDYAPGEEHRYEVCLDGPQSACCCKGFEFAGHCRHIEGLRALKAAGKV